MRRGYDFRLRQPADLFARRTPGLRWIEPRSWATIGLEARFRVQRRSVPGDVRLFEFCLSLPEDQFLRDGTRRWLLRRAMAKRLPAEVLGNERRGIQAADWFERLRAARGRVADEITSLERCDFAAQAVDLPRLRSLLQAVPGNEDAPDSTGHNLRLILETGLTVARFLSWFESGHSE